MKGKIMTQPNKPLVDIPQIKLVDKTHLTTITNKHGHSFMFDATRVKTIGSIGMNEQKPGDAGRQKAGSIEWQKSTGVEIYFNDGGKQLLPNFTMDEVTEGLASTTNSLAVGGAGELERATRALHQLGQAAERANLYSGAPFLSPTPNPNQDPRILELLVKIHSSVMRDTDETLAGIGINADEPTLGAIIHVDGLPDGLSFECGFASGVQVSTLRARFDGEKPLPQSHPFWFCYKADDDQVVDETLSALGGGVLALFVLLDSSGRSTVVHGALSHHKFDRVDDTTFCVRGVITGCIIKT